MKKINQLIVALFICYNLNAQCWKSVDVGYQHVLAIAENNTLWAWGCSNWGQLGNSTLVGQSYPIQIGTDSDWKMISASGGSLAFSLAIKNDGSLWAWGNNTYGQAANGTFINVASPARVGLENNWKTISAGYCHALAVKNNGTLWSWGSSDRYALGNTSGYGAGLHRNVPAQVGVLTNWSSVSASDIYSLALNTSGKVYGWGYNSGDPIGIGGLYIQTPQLRTFNNVVVKSISAGSSHSYELRGSSNLLWTHGSNVYGQAGGTTCAGCPEYYLKAMECGDDTSAIIKTDGTLWFAGKILGETLVGVQTEIEFVQFGTSNNWKSVSVGTHSGAAITQTGEMFTWGWGFCGSLGNGTTSNSISLVKVICPATLKSENFNSNDKISIFPNPAKDFLNIKSSSTCKIFNITIYNSVGQLIKQLSDNDDLGEINVSNLKIGIYVLSVVTDNDVKIFKFQKE